MISKTDVLADLANRSTITHIFKELINQKDFGGKEKGND